ncbi:superoxide dismutase family protein [Winogradskyella alexanderae]|uniref:Superoxide dismutase family protein n=1 Tax=Winogradskyella alexanderae TaxID=2877123 RepID=A0ABS7XQ74_9FLAO|nr:superoxide dismutase family protein [Winogradskyella alexanderae]MCA0132155.1 superoxide dismutase family protein [Winogradskyella alexanderae]
MRYFKLVVFVLSIMVATSCKENKKETEEIIETEVEEVVEGTKIEKTISVTMSPKSDSNVTGTVVFTEIDGMVTMEGTFSGLTEGVHAIHLHEKADCSSPDGTSSGGHWNPTAQPHGAWGATTGFHKGDIGNMTADAEGNATISLTTDEWCIGCGDDTKDIMGKAVIVHQGEDDLTSQPSGAAGARVSCAGIIE